MLAALLTARIVGALDEVPSRGSAAKRWSSGSSRWPTTCGDDEVVMSVLTQGPELAMVYIDRTAGHQPADPASTRLAADIKLAQDEGSVRPGDAASARGHVSADRPVDDPVRTDRRADPRRRRARRRTLPTA